MWKRKKKKKALPDLSSYPKRSVSMEELRKAIDQFAQSLKQGIPLSIIIKDDLTIDYQLIAPYLKAVPEEIYYMSKETYEIFPEDKKELALELDIVQKAVDQYMEITKELPIMDGDPYKQVNYFKLEKLNLLPERPKHKFYITDEEYLITYKKK
jgi:hypothetical protein